MRAIDRHRGAVFTVHLPKLFLPGVLFSDNTELSPNKQHQHYLCIYLLNGKVDDSHLNRNAHFIVYNKMKQ